MALIKCKECGTEVSDKASACVKCGAPPPKRHSGEGIAGTIGAIALIGGIIWAVAQFSGAPANTSAKAAAQSSDAAAASAVENSPDDSRASTPSPPVAPLPSHNYAMEQDGQYGYEAGISDDDVKHGVVSKPLVMYRYRGKIDGAYTVQMGSDGGVTYMVSCAAPCDFVKIRAVLDGRTIKTDTMANAPGSIINAVIEDAMNGQLEISGR